MRNSVRRKARSGPAAFLRRGAALLLAVLLCATMIPADVFAASYESELADGELDVVETEDGLSAGLRHAAAYADTGLFGTCSWLFPENIERDSSDNLLVGKTDLRFVNLSIRINMGSSAHAAKSVKIELPYDLGIGRAEKPDSVKSYCGYYTLSGPGGFTATEDPVNNKIVLTNTRQIAQGNHDSLVVTYSLDCWNIVSGKPVSVPYDINGSIGTLPAIGIETDSNMSIWSSYHSPAAFAGVDSRNLYAALWNKSYWDYFGLSEERFNGDKQSWIYDVMCVTVKPTGQQPYGISGEFVPGRYQADSDQIQSGHYVQPYGWDGELVAMAYQPCSDSRGLDGLVPVGFAHRAAVKYDDLPHHDTRSEYQAGIDKARSHVWNLYSFNVDYTKLGIVSGFAQQYEDSCEEYNLYFLVRYPRNSSSLIGSGTGSESGYMTLDAAVSVTHMCVDSGAVREDFTKRWLYYGLSDNVDYGGNIYAATYIESRCTEDSKNGLSALLSGRSASLKMTSEYYCLNENRANRNRIGNGETYRSWELNAFVDAAFLSEAGASGTGAVLLGEGDYRIASWGIAIIDDYGANSENPDGTWNIGWPDVSKQAVIDRGDGDNPVYVYGSRTLYGDDWVKIAEMTLEDAYTRDDYLVVHDSEKTTIPVGDDYLRLKVVYPDSKLTTAIQINYDIELKPTGPAVGAAVERARADSVISSLLLVNWLNYTAYEPGKYAVPNLQTEKGDVTGDTGDIIRANDAAYPYPGYGGDVYPYRDHVQSKLSRSSDDVGMIVAQALYDRNMNLVGSTSDWQDAYTRRSGTDGNGIGKITYSVQGFVTNYSSDTQMMSGILGQRNEDLVAGLETPYTSTEQRYYVLLPAGLEYADNSVRATRSALSSGTHWKYISDITSLKVGLHGIKNPNTGLTAAWWSNGGFPNLTVRTEMLGNRQLLVIDRSISHTDPGFVASYLTPGNWSGETKVCTWGLGLEFDVVPRKDSAGGTIDLPTGTYETLFAHQFLNGRASQDGVQAVSLADYGGESYLSASDAFGAAGRKMDDYLFALDEQSLMAIKAVFHNESGSGGSVSSVLVRGGDVDPSADDYDVAAFVELSADGNDSVYNYALTYEVKDNSSSDVVLWDNIEAYDRNGVSSEWFGVPIGVDTGNTGAKVYVNESPMNIDEYVTTNDGKGRDHTWLTDPSSGWKLADASTDWSRVKAVAFYFQGMRFDVNGTKSATVYLKMKAPKTVVDQKLDQDLYTAYNEILFSDAHDGTGEKATVLTNNVEVSLCMVPAEPDGGFELPKTGGIGTAPVMAAGFGMVVLAVFLYGRKRRRA